MPGALRAITARTMSGSSARSDGLSARDRRGPGPDGEGLTVGDDTLYVLAFRMGTSTRRALDEPWTSPRRRA
ncbi:hypothetical protein BN2537_2165 [Streptomyces venezuelae]|nr:hypothetical protein BN2537_2165 [Streptomyces venezuelae]